MIEIKENISENTLNEGARQYLFDALNRMNEIQARKNRIFAIPSSRKVVLENIMGDIPSYISRDDLITNESRGRSILDKMSNKIISIKAKIDMKSSKKEKEACKLGLENALNADISQNGQKQYRMNQINEILKEFETAIVIGTLDNTILRTLYYETNQLEKSLGMVGLDQDTYKKYMVYVAKIRYNLAEKLFDLELEQVKGHQKQKTR